MVSLKIKDRDLVLDDINGFEYVDGTEELAQSFQLLIETNLSEWFLKPPMGFDYRELQKKNYDEDLIRFALLETLNQDERFEELLEYNLDVNKFTRQAIVNFRARVSGVELSLTLESEVE